MGISSSAFGNGSLVRVKTRDAMPDTDSTDWTDAMRATHGSVGIVLGQGGSSETSWVQFGPEHVRRKFLFRDECLETIDAVRARLHVDIPPHRRQYTRLLPSDQWKRYINREVPSTVQWTETHADRAGEVGIVVQVDDDARKARVSFVREDHVPCELECRYDWLMHVFPHEVMAETQALLQAR